MKCSGQSRSDIGVYFSEVSYRSHAEQVDSFGKTAEAASDAHMTGRASGFDAAGVQGVRVSGGDLCAKHRSTDRTGGETALQQVKGGSLCPVKWRRVV